MRPTDKKLHPDLPQTIDKNLTVGQKKVIVKEDAEFEAFDTRAVVKTLHTAMEKMIQKELSPSSLHAAAMCAQQIVNIMRVHLEADRLRSKIKGSNF